MTKATFRIGLLVPRSGAAGLWTPSAEMGALLAAAETNCEGGILGRPIDLVIADVGQSPSWAAAQVKSLLNVEGVDAIIGQHPSNLRRAIANAIEGKVAYVYAASYEGGEDTPNVFATGETASSLLPPGISWLTAEKKASSFYLFGSDYEWPRGLHAVAKNIIAKAGGEVLGERFTPLLSENFAGALADIQRLKPDVVLCSVMGSDGVRFNRAFASAGLQDDIIRFSVGTDETALVGIGAEASENLFVTAGFLATGTKASDIRFKERYHSCFGENAPIVNSFCVNTYDAVHFLKDLVKAFGSSRFSDRSDIHNIYIGERQVSSSDDRTLVVNHKPIYLARSMNGLFQRILDI